MKPTTLRNVLRTALLLVPASVFAQTSYTAGVINIPNASLGLTQANGIDANNQVVGTFQDVNGEHGFLLSGGVLTSIDEAGTNSTSATAIDSTRGIVGETYFRNTFYSYKDGNRTMNTISHGANKFVTGINSSGNMVGYDNLNRGFVYSGGVYNYIVPTVCSGLQAPVLVRINGINSHGDMVGYCSATNGRYGWARVNGVDQVISVFGLTTTPFGVNDSGLIVGAFIDSFAGGHGFVYSAGAVTQFDFQLGGTLYYDTNLFGVNNKGSLVGTGVDPNTGASTALYAFAN